MLCTVVAQRGIRQMENMYMAWERRRNQRFYYKSVRAGGKVKKVYFGKGPAAELAATATEWGQRHRKERAAARRLARIIHEAGNS